MASLKNQIKNCFEEINAIGESKRDSRDKGDYSQIHSIKYFKDALGTSIRFGEFCKENFGIKKVNQITPEMTQAYLTKLEGNGVTKGHLINVESHILRFQKGVDKFAEKMGFKPSTFITERQHSPMDRERPVDRSYTPQEIEKLKENMSKNVRTACEMTENLGLRSKEVCNIRVKHIVEIDGRLYVHIIKGTGVTKGGRFRFIPVPLDYQDKLRQLIQNKRQDERIINIKVGTLRSELARACAKTGIESQGWHGFRHTYARKRFDELTKDRLDQARDLVRRMIQNRRDGKRMDTGIRVREKDFYNDVKKTIDQIHSELGHGKKRWELIEVYILKNES